MDPTPSGSNSRQADEEREAREARERHLRTTRWVYKHFTNPESSPMASPNEAERRESAATPKVSITLPLCFALSCAIFGPFQFGYHLAELNAPQAVITCEKKSISSASVHANLPQCIPMTVDQFALVSSIFTLGGFLGALVSGPFCSNHGRRLSMQLMTISFLAGPICQSLAANLGVLVLGRFISGLGAGAAMVVVPIYIAEIAPPESKGLFGALTQITVNIGILVTQLLGYFLSHDSMWRIVLAVPGILGIVQFVGLFFTPESPKWLAEHGHSKTAREILRKLRRYRVNLDEEADSWEVAGSNSDIAEEEALLRAPSSSEYSAPHHASVTSVGILAAIRHPTYRPAIIAVIAVMVAQQLTGINSIVMYSVSLLSSLLPTSAALLSVAVSALNLVMTTACAPLSDRIGRKPCILLSTAGMGLSSILLALGIGYSVKVLGAIATLCFVASFAVGLGPVPFILSSELVNPEAVGAVQSWALAANWLATFVVSQFFPMVNALLGGNGRVYYIFAGFAALFGVFIVWWVPETRGKKGADEVWGREVGDEHQD